MEAIRKRRIILKHGRGKAVLNRHPWIFGGAVAGIEESPRPGDIVDVHSTEGNWLARGYFNPNSQIVIRVLTHDPSEEIDQGFFRNRIERASHIRSQLLTEKTTAYRLVNGEGDFLPGLVVDKYGEYLVVQVTALGMEMWRETVVDVLRSLMNPRAIYERSDSPARRLEGLKPIRGYLHGADIPELVKVRESGAEFMVDLMKGQKTGFYLDQRENRVWAGRLVAERDVLDCFCYTGAFSVYAAQGGANSLVLVDASQRALDLAGRNLAANGLSTDSKVYREHVFEFLRQSEAKYDMVILDPPPFARRKSSVMAASRAYKDINLAAFKLLRQNGLLMSFSCSHYVTLDLFQKIVFAAALDSGRRVEVLGKSAQGVDHPVSIFHPEGEYLKGILCRVVE